MFITIIASLLIGYYGYENYYNVGSEEILLELDGVVVGNNFSTYSFEFDSVNELKIKWATSISNSIVMMINSNNLYQGFVSNGQYNIEDFQGSGILLIESENLQQFEFNIVFIKVN